MYPWLVGVFTSDADTPCSVEHVMETESTDWSISSNHEATKVIVCVPDVEAETVMSDGTVTTGGVVSSK